MNIGNIEFENNVFLAPMAGITDLAFRRICTDFGAGLTYTEMVSAKGIYYNSKNTYKLLKVDVSKSPIAVQLFGSSPEILADMAKSLVENAENPFDIIDINMGCPATKIVKNGEGSALMKNPTLVGKIVNAVSKAVKIPVTVKIRKGFDNSCINAVEIAKIIEQNGGAAVAVHGRTRCQQYSGNADWNIIREVKNAVKIPVIGNGDITSPELALQMINETGCDAIMIGRAAHGDPWIFERVTHYLKTGEIMPNPTIDEKIKISLKQAEMTISEKGEFIGSMEMRRHLCQYIKGIPGAAGLRVKINAVCNLSDIKNIMATLKNF